jgi:oligopeptidase B
MNKKSLLPPLARKTSHTETVHGELRNDPYRWLHRRDSKEVKDYLKSENMYTEKMMEPSLDLQKVLFSEFINRIEESDETVPYIKGDYYYFSRTIKGQQYSILYRSQKKNKTSPEVVLDLNELSDGEAYASFGHIEVCPNSTLVAYSLDFSGFRDFELRLLSMSDRENVDLQPNNVRSFAWANDSRHLFFVTENSAKRPYKVWRQNVISGEQSLVFEERDPLYSVSVSRSRSDKYIFVYSLSTTTNEISYVSADDPMQPLRVFNKRRSNHQYYVEHGENGFYIQSNKDAINSRVMFTSEKKTQEKFWSELIPHHSDVVIDDIQVFKGWIVIEERFQGFIRLRVLDISDGSMRQINLPENLCSVSEYHNEQFDSHEYFFEYESYLSPASVYSYNFKTCKLRLIKQEKVKPYFKKSLYSSELIEVKVEDGTIVPVTIVYKRSSRSTGARPMLLSGYGAYGIPSDPYFSTPRLSLLDRGVIFAVAHVRGGGESGRAWHDKGRMLLKRNSFNDFISCAKHLISVGYTEPKKLMISGGSAGGLLVTAVANMSPELFNGVIADVPFVDVVNTMLDESLPLTVGEYEEWGNPHNKPYYSYIKSYSPYDNVKAQNYPTMLVQTSLNDSQVMYWEPAKYVARLRELKTDSRPLLLKVNMEGGHGGSSGRYDFLREIAFEYSFILGVLGLEE